jgi:hypothetical protein
MTEDQGCRALAEKQDFDRTAWKRLFRCIGISVEPGSFHRK